MQLITVTILLLICGNPTATVFTKLYIYLYEVKRLSNMPKDLVIIHYLRRQYYETIYKPNAALVFYICCFFLPIMAYLWCTRKWRVFNS